MQDKSFYKQTTLPDFVSEQSSKPSPLPAKIGPYKIESLLNKGGMSLLYLGLHPETREPLVIKVLSPEFVSSPEATSRFFKEAEIIELTNHPNIVKLYGQGEWEDGLYIAMEFIRGISLRQFIMQQSLSLKRSIDVILQVAYALCHLHTHGVIHRDLKPENILITEDGEIKVIDFGIAQLHEEKEFKKPLQEKKMMGTPNYMSPEQKEDPHKVTYASDIYSLGIITYELVLGKLSYGIINLTLLPKTLQKIVGKCLAISLQERYSDIVDFITDLSQYLKSGDIEKDKPGSDQMKEIMETLQRAGQLLSPSTTPDWPLLEIGLAKYKGQGQMGLYYDFFKLPGNLYFVLIAETEAIGMETAIYSASLRGMIRTFIHEKMQAKKTPFRLIEMITTLNQMLVEDVLGQHFGLTGLLLDPLNDQSSFVSCGMGSLLHLSQGSPSVRKLLSQNPLLGLRAPNTFSETIDNWNPGDTLFLHTLDLEKSSELESALMQAISEYALSSASYQAEATMRKIALSPAFLLQKHPKMLLSIQRIS